MPRLGTALLALTAAMAVGCRRDHPGPAPVQSASPPVISSAAPVLSDTAAHAMIVDDCLSCHAEQMLAQQRLTPKQWGNVVKKMQGWGAPVEPDRVEPLAAYLAAKYGPEAGPYRVPTIAPADAAAAVAPTPDGAFAGGDAGRGANAYHELCATCHADDAGGAALGVRLADRPLLYRASDFAQVVRAGRGRMPAFRAEDMPDLRIADLLAHLRKLR